MPAILPLFDVGQVQVSVLVRADLRLMGRSWVDQHTGRMSHHGVHATERRGLGQLLLLQQNIEVQRQGATVHRWYRVGLHCVSCLAWVFPARTAGRDRPSWALVLCNDRLLDVMDPVGLSSL